MVFKAAVVLATIALSMAQLNLRTIRRLNPGNTTFNCIERLRPEEVSCGGLENSPFRTINGTCNNLGNPTFGAIDIPLERLLPPKYSDGFDTPRGFPGARPIIPPANRVTKELFNVEIETKGTGELSVLFMTMGQFLDHDIALSPHGPCNVSKCSTLASFAYPCYPILFANRRNSSCTAFGRAIPVCQNGENELQRPREQINEITAFIDGSQIYGSTLELSERLRRNDGTGKLLLSPKSLLAIDELISPCPVIGGCSLVGDERGDENIALHSMHTLWVREHNRIAAKLKFFNPSWEEERLYQTARKIVGAILQHILYSEWIPNIANLPDYEGYNQFVNPSIANAFSTAAFRFGHSLIPNKFSQLNVNFDDKSPPITLQEAFLNREIINERGIEPTMLGLLANTSNNVDNGFAFGVARKLFIRPGDDGFVDLTAYNIQRGRDHALPTYGDWRRTCGLPAVRGFNRLRRFVLPGTLPAFRNLYRNGDEVDLFAGGISERPAKGLQVGPTFACIMREQFTRLRDGDRFYYEAEGVFTDAQLTEIKKVTMARVLCDNLNGIISIQPRAFNVPSETNVRQICQNLAAIPKIDLTVF